MAIVKVEYTITDKETDEELDIIVHCEWERIVSAIRTGNPDNWSPQEGGFEGITKVTKAFPPFEELQEESWKDLIDEDRVVELIADKLEE